MVRRRCPVIDLLNWNRVLWIFHTYMYEFTVLLFYRMDYELFVRPLWDAQWDKCLPHWLFWVVCTFSKRGQHQRQICHRLWWSIWQSLLLQTCSIQTIYYEFTVLSLLLYNGDLEGIYTAYNDARHKEYPHGENTSRQKVNESKCL